MSSLWKIQLFEGWGQRRERKRERGVRVDAPDGRQRWGLRRRRSWACEVRRSRHVIASVPLIACTVLTLKVLGDSFAIRKTHR